MEISEHVDTDTIAMLKDVMEDGFENLIHTYLQDSDTRIAALQQALTSGDAEAFRQAAHSLKGSSGNVGCTRMSALAFQLEEKGRSGDLSGVEGLLMDVNAEFEILREYLMREM